MGQQIINSPIPNHIIEYNGYRFNAKCKSRLSIMPDSDESHRTESSRTYRLRVTGWITPRRPIPGDDDASGIQLPAPYAKVPIPGYDPLHYFATTDSEIGLIRCKLTEQGKTLRYTGQGSNDIYVNTTDPNLGVFVQDLNFGPHTKLNALEPRGFNKAWYIDWEAEFTIQTCCRNTIDFNLSGKRIQEYSYSVSYTVNAHSMTRRTISGKLTIIPPMYRGKDALTRQGFIVPGGDVQQYIEAVTKAQTQLDQLETDFAAAQEQLTTAQAQFFAAQIKSFVIPGTLNIAKYQGMGTTDIATDLLNQGYSNASGLAAAITNLFNAQDQVSLTVQGIQNAQSALDLAQNDLNRIQGIVNGIARKPAQDNLFDRGPVPMNLTFGPLPQDNTGNVQNYETADQYRDIIDSSIIIPFNFKRVNRQFDISPDKRTIRFVITDEERPSFSFVPGYDEVNIRHNTESANKGFSTWKSTLTATFKMPKFINTIANPRGYSKVANNTPDVAKTAPRKLVAYMDFIKIIYQRFAVSLLKRQTNNLVKVQTAGGQIVDRYLTVGTIFPTSLSVSENVMDNEISFSISYFIQSDLDFIWQMTGHGLPCILAADLSVDGSQIGANQLGGVNADSTVGYVGAIFFSNYSDALTHGNWLYSQKYANLNPRGSAELIFDRTYDKPINICDNPNDASSVIPKHLDSQAPLAPLGKKTTQAVKIPSWKTLGANERKLGAIEKLKELYGKFSPLNGMTLGWSINQWFDVFTSGANTDLFLSNNFAINGYPDKYEDDEDLGEILALKFDENADFSQNDSSVAFFDNSTEDIIINKLFSNSGEPEPSASWIAYHCDLEMLTDNHTIRHKLTPKFDFSPQSETGPFLTLIENNFREVVPTGPDNIIGESIKNQTFLENLPEDDIIQYMASPSNTVILRGYAIRSTYQPVAPTLLMYANKRAYQRRRRVKTGIIGEAEANVFAAQWEIEYILLNTPIGPLAVPDDPTTLSNTEDYTLTTDDTDNLEEDLFVLSEIFEDNAEIHDEDAEGS